MKTLLDVLITFTIWHCASCFETKNSSVTYLYGLKCYFGHQRLSEKSAVYLQYDGVPILCDEISFLAAQGDSHQLCLTPLYYHDPYCEIFMEYKSYTSGDVLKTVKCTDNHTVTWCSEKEDTVNVKIQMESLVRQWTNARVKIKLESKPKTTTAGSEPPMSLHITLLWSAIIVASALILLTAILSGFIKRTGRSCRGWAMGNSTRAEEAAIGNSDSPPSYHEATHPRALEDLMPPKYSDIFHSKLSA